MIQEETMNEGKATEMLNIWITKRNYVFPLQFSKIDTSIQSKNCNAGHSYNICRLLTTYNVFLS